MNELTSIETIRQYLEDQGLQALVTNDRIDLQTIQGTEPRVCVIHSQSKDIDQESHAMLTFTVPMAEISHFRDQSDDGLRPFMEFMFRALDLNSLSSMDPFAVVILSPETDKHDNEIIALRASLVNDVFAFSAKSVRAMVSQMELALAMCEDLMNEFFEMSVEERVSATS